LVGSPFIVRKAISPITSTPSRRDLFAAAGAALVSPASEKPSSVEPLLERRRQLEALENRLARAAERLGIEQRRGPSIGQARELSRLCRLEARIHAAIDRLDDAIASYPAASLRDAMLKLRFFAQEQGYALAKRGLPRVRTISYEEKLLGVIIGDLERLESARR
jgi:hypothetical protein